jgi:hypothetical protein
MLIGTVHDAVVDGRRWPAGCNSGG